MSFIRSQAKLVLPVAGTPRGVRCGERAVAVCGCSDEDAAAKREQQRPRAAQSEQDQQTRQAAARLTMPWQRAAS